jgi:hypothetical protein
VAQEIMTRIMFLSFVNEVTPKAAAKLDLLFNKLASEVVLLNIKVRPMQHNKV